jgi:hypothetical protein
VIGAATNPGAGSNPVEQLVEQVEIGLERPFNPVNQMDRIDWAVAINSEMPWHLPSVVEAAAVVLEQRYWKGTR